MAYRPPKINSAAEHYASRSCECGRPLFPVSEPSLSLESVATTADSCVDCLPFLSASTKLGEAPWEWITPFAVTLLKDDHLCWGEANMFTLIQTTANRLRWVSSAMSRIYNEIQHGHFTITTIDASWLYLNGA